MGICWVTMMEMVMMMGMKRVTWTSTMKARETNWLTREMLPSKSPPCPSGATASPEVGDIKEVEVVEGNHLDKEHPKTEGQGKEMGRVPESTDSVGRGNQPGGN